MRSICIFCGSSPGANPAYMQAAVVMGKLLAERKLRLIYGGGNVGLMGGIADAALAAGGEVIGVIPQSLASKEVAHQRLSRLVVVETMHERKAAMADLSDAFIALPGGIGTMEEFFEIWTWGQLGLHSKPYALLNVAGFYDPMLDFVDRLVEQRFVRAEHREMLLVDESPQTLVERLLAHRVGRVPKWIDRQQT